ncbi:MAG: lipoprotein-releasing system transmembrane subunit LolC, partial [Pseudohongiellaceae bacterium]
MHKSVALYIGRRYTSLRSRNLLVGFISSLSVAGLSLGVAILITALSIVNGFERELQERILGLLPHISVNTMRNSPLMPVAQWQDYIRQIEASDGVT